jgi:hypothetical protein
MPCLPKPINNTNHSVRFHPGMHSIIYTYVQISLSLPHLNLNHHIIQTGHCQVTITPMYNHQAQIPAAPHVAYKPRQHGTLKAVSLDGFQVVGEEPANWTRRALGSQRRCNRA